MSKPRCASSFRPRSKAWPGPSQERSASAPTVPPGGSSSVRGSRSCGSAVVTLAHRNLVRVLEDETGPISTEGGEVVLDLRPLIIQLGEQVAIFGDLSTRLTPDAGRITIMEADQLETAQDLTQAHEACWARGSGSCRSRSGRSRSGSRAVGVASILRMIGISSIVTGLIVLVVRRVAGSIVVGELTNVESVEKAAGDAWDILTSQLRDGGLTLIGMGVILLVAVWLGRPVAVGNGRAAVAGALHQAPEIAFGAAALLLFALVWWGPTVQTAALAARRRSSRSILALGVEVLRRQTAREFPCAGALASSGCRRKRSRSTGAARAPTAPRRRM